MSFFGNFKTLSDIGDPSQVQIHVAGDFYNGPITNSAVGGQGNLVSIENAASENIREGEIVVSRNELDPYYRDREELRRIADWLTKQKLQRDTKAADEQNAFKEWTKFREWLSEDEATLSLAEEVPGTLSLSEMPQVKKAIEILEDDLIPSSPSTESKIFNLKMLGDCYRYIAQSVTNADKDELESVVLKSWKTYEEASRIVVPALSPIHPMRLGLAMSMALFQHDILNSPERALYLLHHAWTEGSDMIDTITEEMWKDSILMLQRVRNNLVLWASDLQDDPEDIDVPELDD